MNRVNYACRGNVIPACKCNTISIQKQLESDFLSCVIKAPRLPIRCRTCRLAIGIPLYKCFSCQGNFRAVNMCRRCSSFYCKVCDQESNCSLSEICRSCHLSRHPNCWDFKDFWCLTKKNQNIVHTTLLSLTHLQIKLPKYLKRHVFRFMNFYSPN